MRVLVFASSLLSTPSNHTSGLGTHPLETISPNGDAPGTLTLPNLTYGSTVQGSRVKTIALLPKNLSVLLHICVFSYMIQHLCLYSTFLYSLAFSQLRFIGSASRHMILWAEARANLQTPFLL